MRIVQLINQLRVALNSEDHTPQDWKMFATQLSNLANKAHSRIVVGREGERADDDQK